MVLGIFCAGSLGKEIFDLVSQGKTCAYWAETVFIDDVTKETQIFGCPILRYDDFVAKYSTDEAEIVIATGEPYYRKRLWDKVTQDGYRLARIVCKDTFVGNECVVSPGTVLFPFVFIGNQTMLDENIIVHAGARIEGSCKIGKHTFVSSGAFVGADTKVGTTVFLGPNSALRDHIAVNDDAVVGMGSVVIASVEENRIVAGNPARVIRENEKKTVFV